MQKVEQNVFTRQWLLWDENEKTKAEVNNLKWDGWGPGGGGIL